MIMFGCMAASTVICVIFGFFFLSADDNLTAAMLTSCRETQIENIKAIQLAMKELAGDMKQTQDMHDKALMKQAKKLKKRMTEAQKLLELYTKNKISGLDMIPVAGYRLMQMMGWDSANPTVKTLYRKCCQFKEKKEAMNNTYYLLGALFGYSMLGTGAFFTVLGLGLALGFGTRSLVAAAAVLTAFLLFGYIPYDNVNVIVNKRAEEIERTFPQAVSKLTLLTVAGMEVNQAWKLTSVSGTGTLYDEMKRVLVDLDNNVSPMEAYSKFLSRCNNKYTTKLATAIIQNISKGNAEIVRMLRSLNEESWMEHKHNARRMGDRIQSRLLIPTILMFIGILILVIVPVLSGFGF